MKLLLENLTKITQTDYECSFETIKIISGERRFDRYDFDIKLMGSKVKISFYPTDVDFSFVNNKPAIRIFGVTADSNKILLLDFNFKPYFYATIKTDMPVEQVAGQLGTREFMYRGRKIGFSVEKSAENELKIQTDLPSDVPALQDFIKQQREVLKTDEYDIRFYRRYMIDNKILPFALHEADCEPATAAELPRDVKAFNLINIKNTSADMFSQRVLAFDIETLSAGRFPNPKADSIVMAGFYGSGGFRKVITWKRFRGPEYVQIVDGEKELIEEFHKVVRLFAPQVLVGYGSDNFDLPFLKARAEKYGLKLALNSDGSETAIKVKGRRAAKTFGLQHIDISHFVRNIVSIETSRFKLDAVAKELIGKGKVKTINPEKIGDVWHSGKQELLANLAEYNLMDAQLAFEISEKLLPTELQLIKLLNLNLFDVNRMTYGQLVEWFLINNAHGIAGMRIPARPKRYQVFERRRQTFTGAFVFEPKPGFYKNTAVFDFRSLYPSIIASHNLSPETINCSCCSDRKTATDEGEYWSCTKRGGFFAELIKDLIERRKRISQILSEIGSENPAYVELQARQHALKYIANSMYGYLGFAGSRWYSIESAKTTTALGRKYIQQVIKEAAKFGLNVIYGDTDSLFVENTGRQAAEDFLKIINAVLPKPMELELKGIYPAGIFLERKSGEKGAKKRYALLTESGAIVMKGLEAVRGDWSKLAKKAQKKVIELVLKTGNVDEAKAFVQDLIKKVRNHEIQLDDFVISVRLTKDVRDYAIMSPHVAAAMLAQQKGLPIGKGSVVSYVVTKGESDKISDRVKLAEDATVADCDTEYYVESQVMRAVFKIFEIFGGSVGKLNCGQQTLA